MNFSYALRGLPPAAPTYARQEARSEGPWAGAQPWGTSVPAGQRECCPRRRPTPCNGRRMCRRGASSGCASVVRSAGQGEDLFGADPHGWHGPVPCGYGVGKVMSERPVTVIGFVPAALATPAEFRPDRSVILIEEPGVVRTRGVRAAAADAPVVRELVEWDTRRRARPARPRRQPLPLPARPGRGRRHPPRPRVPRTGELRRRRRLRPAGQQDPRPAPGVRHRTDRQRARSPQSLAHCAAGYASTPCAAGPWTRRGSGAGSSTSRAGSASISSTDRTSSPPIFTTPGRESPSEASASCSSAP